MLRGSDLISTFFVEFTEVLSSPKQNYGVLF